MGNVVKAKEDEAKEGRKEEAYEEKPGEDDEEIEGTKRQRTPEEEVAKLLRKTRCEQPGASSRSKDEERVEVPKDEEALPPPQVDANIEFRKPKIGRQPLLPTKSEIDEHFPLHLNYRSWCKHCVSGKARSNQHTTKEQDEEQLGITWNADYAFMGGDYNEQEEGMQASLVMYDNDKDSFWAVGVEEKGATEEMIKYGVGYY